MRRKIVGYHRDDRVAELDCGHGQHMRHNPPWVNRPWPVSSEGRDVMLGLELHCKLCDVPVDREGVDQ